MPSLATERYSRVLDSPDYDFIRGPAQADFLGRQLLDLAACSDFIGVDTETTGLDPHRNQVRLIQVASDTSAVIVDLDGFRSDGRLVDWSQPGLRELRALLQGVIPKVLQNAAFDINFLKCEGISLGGHIFDTMIAAKIVNNGTNSPNDLGSIVKRNLHVELPKELQRADWSKTISSDMLTYAARDAICLPLLVPVLSLKLQSAVVKDKTLYDVFQLEMEALTPIALMQWRGFCFDVEAAQLFYQDLQQQADALRLVFLEKLDQLIQINFPNDPHLWLPRDPDGSVNTREKDSGSKRLGTKVYKGFNPRSPKQMAQRLQQAGVLLPPDSKGDPSLDQNLLAGLRGDFEIVRLYLEWKSSVTRVSDIQKLIESLGPDGRIHCSYRQMGTETGRLSAASPNLQQVNRSGDFRSKFTAQDGYSLVVADFSQVELRVAAALSGEPKMIEAYRSGRDLHRETASLMANVPFEEVTKSQRQSAKIANFGLLFGAGAATLRKQAIAQYGLDMTQAEAQEIVNGFRRAYPVLHRWQQEQGTAKTKCVFTALGRRRMMLGYTHDKYTTRINTQVQGTAGDITKLSIARIWGEIIRAPAGEVFLIATVHDEIVLEVKDGFEKFWGDRLKLAMESAGSEICPSVPIIAEVSSGKTWAEAK